MKIAIVGSRTFLDYEILERFILSKIDLQGIEMVVSGGAKGADTLGNRFAKNHDIELLEFKADWKKYGKRAGFIRNHDIIKNCDICFAFWDGESHGTKHDLELCEEYDKKCYVYNFILNHEV